MILSFATPKLQKAANDTVELERLRRRKNAPCTTHEIITALNSLEAADSLSDLPPIPWHPHPLKGGKKGLFSVWVNKKTRILFHPDHSDDTDFRIDNPKTITRIVITELCVDYHGH